MSYDDWKTRSPDDELDQGEQPEVWEECAHCQGQGSFEVYEDVSKWSIDPPCARVLACETCAGAGGFIHEAPGDFR